MFGILANLIERPTIRYLIVYLLGATTGIAGGHAILAGMATGFIHLFGIHNPHPTIKP